MTEAERLAYLLVNMPHHRCDSDEARRINTRWLMACGVSVFNFADIQEAIGRKIKALWDAGYRPGRPAAEMRGDGKRAAGVTRSAQSCKMQD